MTKRTRELNERMSALEKAVDQIGRSIEKIEVATIVRDPSSALSVDAYDGLRRQIVAAAGERVAHLHQLAKFAMAVAGAGADQLPALVDEWMAQAGLARVDDPKDKRYYDVLGGEGRSLRVLRPAYIDHVTGRPIVMGQAERHDVQVPTPGQHQNTGNSQGHQENHELRR